MASFLRIALVAVLVSSAMGFALGAMPSQTVGPETLVQGMGQPAFPAPTDAPSLELVRARMQKRAVTNVCTEWTIPGGFGQPECYNSETCLFTSASGYYYEGCGQTSIAYDWVTECWDYPQSGLPPVSEIYCPASAPYCGWFAFVLGVGYTYYNFGCSTVSYGLFVDLLPTTTGGSSATVVLNGGGTTSITDVASTIYVTASSGASGGQTSVPNQITSTVTEGGSASSTTSTSNPIINSHSSSSKTPVGAIAGGVIGGIAVIAFVAFLIWFILRKKGQDKAKAAEQQAQTQQQQADAASAAAFANSHRVSEIGGTNIKPFIGAYAPTPGPEKQSAVTNTNKMYRPTQPEQPQHQSVYGDNLHAISQSPPPVYTHPQPSPQTPYNEIPRPVSVAPPVSPLGTVGSQSPQPNVAEMYQQPYQQSYQQQYQQPVQPQYHQQQATELGGENRGSWQVPQGYQEMAVPAPQNVPRPPQGPPPGHHPTPQPMPVPQGISEMSTGTSTGPRPPQGPPPGHVVNSDITEMSATNTGPRLPPGPPPGHGGGGFDMSGAPMSEDLGHYELE